MAGDRELARYRSLGGALVIAVELGLDQVAGYRCGGCGSAEVKKWADAGVPGYSAAKRQNCAANWARIRAGEHAEECRRVKS